MREILFRAKRLDNGEWIEGYPVKYPSGKVEIFKECGESPDILLRCEINPETLCQYTGLKDKNGNRIWENDIVEDKRFNGFYKIVFRVRDGGWYVKDVKTGALFRIIGKTCWQYERCGNIFDNPELLKGE